MNNYQSVTGTKAVVRQVGKKFEVVIDFPAGRSVPAEQKVVKCNAWSGVEKQLNKWNLNAS